MLALLQAAAVAAPALPALPLVVEEETLGNGIRVAAVHVPDSSLVAVQVRVSGGAADEAPGESGYAHLLEHLMFGGSAHARNGSYDTWLAEVGAENNAWTEHDSTTYSVTAPAEAVELVLFLESDRLGWLAGGMDAEKLRNQIEVVAAEAAGDAAAPHGRDLAALNAAVFPVGHPYHAPVIGNGTDVARADVASLLAYEARAHSPEKVSVVVAGPEPTETSLALARRWFADVPVRTPPSPVAGRPFAGEAVLETPGRGLYSWRDAVRADAIYLAWPTVPRGHPDEPALDILARSLGEGSEPSLSAGRRMRRAGVQTVECWTLNGRYGGLFVVELRTTGRDPAAALAALQHAWKQARPDPARLRAVQVGWHADAIRSSQGVEALAGRVIECMGRGAPADCARSDLRRYAQVRTDALARVRERWLRPERQTILMVVDPARAVPPGAEPVVLP